MEAQISDETIDHLLQQFWEATKKRAKAAGTYAKLEHLRPALKARLMHESKESTIAAQEREALANPEYHGFIEGLAVAKEQELLALGEYEGAKFRIELTRTQNASRRIEMKHLG